MHILAVDDERLALRLLTGAIRTAVPDCTLTAFQTAAEALAHAQAVPQDVAFLDINLCGMNGLALAKRLKDIHGRTNIVFVTGHAEYAVDAFALAASGYVLKPVTPEAITQALLQLRHPVATPRAARVYIRCFGSFAVFVDDKPLLFPRAKPKELLAYLVHKNGATATSAEIASILWEDKLSSRSLQSQARKTIAQLQQLLREAGAQAILQKGWNAIAVDVRNVSCDYYAFLKGHVDSVNGYTGEYLTDYSWAEFTIGQLDRRAKDAGKAR